MPLDLVIRDALVVGPRGPERMAIGIEGGRIVALSAELSERATETIGARGLHAFPGVIDAHVHFNDPGRADWEGVDTGSSALVAGGGTFFIDMPLNSSPPTLDRASFESKISAFRGKARADFALWGGLTPDNLDEMEALAECGVVGFKAFMSSSGIEDFRSCDDETLFRGMQIAARLGLPVAVHAENDGMTRALAGEARAAGRTGPATTSAPDRSPRRRRPSPARCFSQRRPAAPCTSCTPAPPAAWSWSARRWRRGCATPPARPARTISCSPRRTSCVSGRRQSARRRFERRRSASSFWRRWLPVAWTRSVRITPLPRRR